MKIAILGGGVAGVSSAIALKQKGFDVSVYERQDAVATIGAGIVVWPNAAFVLERLGVLEDMTAISGTPARMRRLSSTNQDLGAIDIEMINKQMGYPSLSVLRAEFQGILISKLESLGVAIQYGHEVRKIETQDSGQAEVRFRNGSKTTADILIGADGRMASYARRYVHGNNAPVYQGFINWIGVFESDNDFFNEIAVEDYWGVGKRFGIVPVTERKAYWAGGGACAAIDPRIPSKYKEELSALFYDWPKPVQHLIGHTPIERINKIYVHDHDPIRTWHKHNLIVIGDAAHAPLPTSGQGACQALEDAWHLANCLAKYPHNLARAFAEFTDIRYEKTASIIVAARGFASSLFNRDETYCMKRDESSKKADFSGMALGMSRFWGQHLPL